MPGSAAVCPEFRGMHDGLEQADSYTFNPHKWLFTNFDCNCTWVRDREPLVRTLTVMPEYLKNAATESGRGDRLPGLAGAARASIQGVQALVRASSLRCRGTAVPDTAPRGLARTFAELVRNHPLLECSVPRSLALVCFHHVDGDEATRAMLEGCNDTGRMLHDVTPGWEIAMSHGCRSASGGSRRSTSTRPGRSSRAGLGERRTPPSESDIGSDTVGFLEDLVPGPAAISSTTISGDSDPEREPRTDPGRDEENAALSFVEPRARAGGDRKVPVGLPLRATCPPWV